MKSKHGKFTLGKNRKVLRSIAKTPRNVLSGLNAKYALHTIIAQYKGLFLWLLLILEITLKRILKVRVPFFIPQGRLAEWVRDFIKPNRGK